MLTGQVLFLRCFFCKRVYGGRWRWDNVPENSAFPNGFHHPRLATAQRHPSKWFYATPQIVWEVHLVVFIFSVVARGGLSLTATFEVYKRLWCSGMAQSMYAHRQHFIAKLTVALLTWVAIVLIAYY